MEGQRANLAGVARERRHGLARLHVVDPDDAVVGAGDERLAVGGDQGQLEELAVAGDGNRPFGSGDLERLVRLRHHVDLDAVAAAADEPAIVGREQDLVGGPFVVLLRPVLGRTGVVDDVLELEEPGGAVLDRDAEDLAGRVEGD